MMYGLSLLVSLHEVHDEGCGLSADGSRFLANRRDAQVLGSTNTIESYDTDGASPLSRSLIHSNGYIVTVAEDSVTGLFIDDLHADLVAHFL